MTDKPNRTWYCGRCLTTFQGELTHCPNLNCRVPTPADGWAALYEPGDIIDRNYRVLRRLATGGAGAAYLAREIGPDDEMVGVELAVKILYANRDHGSYLRRLSQEAQILRDLAHPHIVEYRGFVDRAGHSPYLVTRFEKGGSLFDHIKRKGRLSLTETAGIGCQVLEALDRAHQVNVIHRDLKPENVLLDRIPEAGEIPNVRVADFGIAKVQSSLSDGMTRVGSFVGTPQFAAPEQFDGALPTPATDVFATGALLYFCLCRQALLPGASRLAPEDARDLLLQKLPVRLPVIDPNPDMQRAMQDIMDAAMAAVPEARITAREMNSLLEGILSGNPIPRPALTMVPVDDMEIPDPVPTPAPQGRVIPVVIPKVPSIEAPPIEAPPIPSVETPPAPSIEAPPIEAPPFPSIEAPPFPSIEAPPIEAPPIEAQPIKAPPVPSFDAPPPVSSMDAPSLSGTPFGDLLESSPTAPVVAFAAPPPVVPTRTQERTPSSLGILQSEPDLFEAPTHVPRQPLPLPEEATTQLDQPGPEKRWSAPASAAAPDVAPLAQGEPAVVAPPATTEPLSTEPQAPPKKKRRLLSCLTMGCLMFIVVPLILALGGTALFFLRPDWLRAMVE